MMPELSGDFLQWLCCCYIAKSGSVRKAAEILDKTPSIISYQLKCLENDLGTVLFDRYKKSLIITGDGKRLLDWAITTFETLQGMRSSVETSDEHSFCQTFSTAYSCARTSFFPRRQGRSCEFCASIFCVLLQLPRPAGAGSCGKPKANTAKKRGKSTRICPFFEVVSRFCERSGGKFPCRTNGL